jgi:hypothetical protein
MRSIDPPSAGIQPEVRQVSDYYPFGMEFGSMLGGDNKYLYNGKEMQDDLIGGAGVEWYDYGARMRWSNYLGQIFY